MDFHILRSVQDAAESVDHDSARLTTRSPLLGALAAVVVLFAAASLNLGRGGFTPDEEITATIARRIAETGFPTLPSGVLYLRGVPFSYAAWGAGVVFGQQLVVYRGVSLLFASLAVILIFWVACEATTASVAVWACLLFASFPLLIASSVFARFYSAFVASFLCTLWLFLRSQRRRDRASAFLLMLAACRLLHEFAVVLVLLPLCYAACTDSTNSTDRRRALILFAKAAALLAVTEVVLASFGHLSARQFGTLASPSFSFDGQAFLFPSLGVFRLADPVGLIVIGVTLIVSIVVTHRLTGAPWAVLAASGICGFFFVTGPFLLVALLWMLARPREWARIALGGLMLGLTSVAIWVLHTAAATDAQLSLRLAGQLAASTIGYPWEGLREIGRTLPLLTAAAAFGVARLLASTDDRASATALRALAQLGITAVTALGISRAELHWRYLILALPTIFIVAAYFVDSTWRSVTGMSAGVPPHRLTKLLVAAAFLIVFVSDAYVVALSARGLAPTATRSLLAPPTDSGWQLDRFYENVMPSDALVCNDELACRFLVGRVDYWLLLTTSEIDRYTALVPGGRRQGLYAGADVITNATMLTRAIECDGRPVSIVVLDLSKFGYREARDVALDMISRFGGTIRSMGGQHLIVHIPAPRHAACS